MPLSQQRTKCSAGVRRAVVHGENVIPRCIPLTSNTPLASEHLVSPLAAAAEGMHHLASCWALTFSRPIIWFSSESREINKLNLAFTQI